MLIPQPTESMQTSQEKRRIKTSNTIKASNMEGNQKIPIKSPATIVVKKIIMPETAPSEKTSGSLSNLHIYNY